MALRPLCGLAAGWLLAGCATHVNPYYDASKPHHAPDGFRNNHIARVNKPFSDLVRWRIAAIRDGLPPPAKEPTPTAAPNLAQLQQRQPSVTWIGHASTLVQCGGLNVLTDPVFSERASPLDFVGPKRAQPPGIALADLPPIDVVVISHNHYDHLDLASVRALSDRSDGRTLILVPLGLKPFLEREGVRNVAEMDWWDRRVVGGVEFHLVPVQHWSARGLGDRNQTLWGGWAVFAPDLRWYFSGDTGYSRDFADTRARLAAKARDGVLFDVALLAIGAYEPRWFMTEQHMNPAEAVQAHKDLGARRSVGIHWGTFSLTDEPLDAPPRDLAAARRAMGVADEDFFVVKIGETRTIAP
ncbi:MBL fold metallo-hydrolase [Ramlibacter sp. PS4R-6]|uniref:MBL fold metallo-hydrolase n=1 Tax=Ramlibacter sp. PS4R-6 TaxID=3133438 RepID=UPI0030B240D0